MSWKDKFPKENRYFETDNGIIYWMNEFEFKDLIDIYNVFDVIIDNNPPLLKTHKIKQIYPIYGNMYVEINKPKRKFICNYDYIEVKTNTKILYEIMIFYKKQLNIKQSLLYKSVEDFLIKSYIDKDDLTLILNHYTNDNMILLLNTMNYKWVMVDEDLNSCKMVKDIIERRGK